MPQRMLIVAAAALAVLLGCATAVEAPTPTAVAWQPSALGFYSLEQAARGRRKFRQVCSECHFVSEFRGPDFESEWQRQTVWDLFRQVVRTMPEDNPGSLTQQTYADVIAYILQLNEYAAGDVELVPSQEAMDAIPLGPGTASVARSPRSWPDLCRTPADAECGPRGSYYLGRGRSSPIFLTREVRVVGFTPSRSAAPPGP